MVSKLGKEYRVDLDMVADVYSKLAEKLFSLRIRKFVDHLKQNELSLNQFTILFLIYRGESCSSSQLCDKLQLKAASVSYLIDSLEKRGLVERVENPEDRRSQHIVLTPEGRSMSAFPDDNSYFKEVFENRSPDELETIYLALRLLNDKWQS